MDKNELAKETSLAILDEVFANYPARVQESRRGTNQCNQ